MHSPSGKGRFLSIPGFSIPILTHLINLDLDSDFRFCDFLDFWVWPQIRFPDFFLIQIPPPTRLNPCQVVQWVHHHLSDFYDFWCISWSYGDMIWGKFFWPSLQQFQSNRGLKIWKIGQKWHFATLFWDLKDALEPLFINLEVYKLLQRLWISSGWTSTGQWSSISTWLKMITKVKI